MPTVADENKARKLVITNGEGYELRALDFLVEGIKIELYDTREMDRLEDERLHAVLLSPRKARELFMWIGKR